MVVVSDSLVEMRAFVRPVQAFFQKLELLKPAEFLDSKLSASQSECLFLFDLREDSFLRKKFLEGAFAFQAQQKCWVLGPKDSYYRREFFKLGCDFYIDADTHSLDLYAKVLGTQEAIKPEKNLALPQGLKLDLSMQQLYSEGESCGLSSTEFRIFMTLLESSSTHLKREEIRDRVWGQDFKISVRSIDSHISRMRRKIPENMLRIEADRNRGYRLNHATS